MPLRFGVLYTPQGGPFKDQEICFWKNFDNPVSFTNRFDAEKLITFIKRNYPNSKPRVVTEKDAHEHSKKMLEQMREPGFGMRCKH